MQQNDIAYTGGSSFALIRGHILDFYEYSAQYLGENNYLNYLIPTYIIFALWNIPLALVGLVYPPTLPVPYGVLMWYKALPTLFFVLSSFLFRNIIEQVQKDSENSDNSNWDIFLFLTTPTAFFSQMIFGQYDIFTVFFMLLAIQKYFGSSRKDFFFFSLFFGLATTFKYLALLFYLPLLLYREKRFRELLKSLILYFIPITLAILPYIGSNAFINGVFGFGVVSYIFIPIIPEYIGKLYLVPFLWSIICVYAYSKKSAIGVKKQCQDIAFLGNLGVWIAFGISFWHPQWLMIATPFLVLSLIQSEQKSLICLLDLLSMLCFSIFVVNTWPDHVDQNLFSLGLFRSWISPRLFGMLKMRNIYPHIDRDLVYTGFSALLMARTILSYPDLKETVPFSDLSTHTWYRLRGYVGISIFVIPMIICLISAIHAPLIYFNTSVSENSIKISYLTSADCDEVQFAVWSEEEGQDDLQWYPAEQQDDTSWKYDVDLKKHGSIGNYYIHVYVNTDGVQSRTVSTTVQV